MSRFVQAATIPWRRVGDDILLAPAGRDDFDHLSGTAAVVWSILETPSSRANLVSALAELYSAPPDDIATDVDVLVADLTHRGVIQEIP